VSRGDWFLAEHGLTVMVFVLGPGGRRDDNDDTSLCDARVGTA
jgi:hypothetical protein